MAKLKIEYKNRTKEHTVDFFNGYNPSHLAGLGDLAESAAQIMGTSISNFDRDTILLQMYPQVTTRKLLLVGHSQGAFYSNALYDYLLAHGEPRAAVGVYQVGSPASFVAGGGKYINSSGDTMLGMLRGLGFRFLANNIDLVSTPDDATKNYPGHSFSSAYLAGAPERIVGDIQSEIGALTPDAATDTGDCFTPPPRGMGYETTKAAFAVADTAAVGVRAGAGAVQTAAVAAGNVLALALQGAYGVTAKVVSDIGITVGGVAGITHAAEPQSGTTNFDLLKKLYGSSLTKDDYQELVGTLGSAVATAPVFGAVVVQDEPQKITYLGGTHSHTDVPTDTHEDTAPSSAPDVGDVQSDSGEVPEATTTEPEPAPEPAPEPTPEPLSFTIASQEDESHLCDDPDWGGWLNCYANTDTGTYSVDLGQGLLGALDSVTIAKDPASPFNLFHPYLITIECFTDAYVTPCTDWVMPGAATANRSDAVVQKASENLGDGKHWIANFVHKDYSSPGIEYPAAADGTSPVQFNPAQYYRLTISDQGWSTGVYGSATEPYWVLTGGK